MSAALPYLYALGITTILLLGMTMIRIRMRDSDIIRRLRNETNDYRNEIYDLRDDLNLCRHQLARVQSEFAAFKESEDFVEDVEEAVESIIKSYKKKEDA